MPTTILAFEVMGYMGGQLGITQIADKLDTQYTVNNIPASITNTLNQSGIQTGTNLGVMVGGMFYTSRFALGADIRLSHLEYNQTREYYQRIPSQNQIYGNSQTTRINNFNSILLKFGTFVLSDALLYAQTGLGLISTKVDYVQSLSNAGGFQSAYTSHSKKNPGLILGLGLEILFHPNLSLYYDFNYTYFSNFENSSMHSANNINFFFDDTLQQGIFQAVIGLKWHTHKSPRHIDGPIAGWYAGSSLGLMQTNLLLIAENALFRASNRQNNISPDLAVFFGKSWTKYKWALMVDGTLAIHPLRQSDHLQIALNGNETLNADLKTPYTVSLQFKPARILYNRLLYAILGVGGTTLKQNDHSSWETLLMAGWGLETPVSHKMNLRAEYVFAYANKAKHHTTNTIRFSNEKLTQQKGTLGLVYYFC